MRIKEGFMLRQLGDQYVVVALGKASEEFHGVVRLNGAGAFLWEQLSAKEQTEEQLLKSMLNQYMVTEVIAREDINVFIQKLKSAKLLKK